MSVAVVEGQAQPAFVQRMAAEALGTAFLLAAVVGSGIMAERLAPTQGIRPSDAPAFVAAQLGGAALATGFMDWLAARGDRAAVRDATHKEAA